MAGAERGGAELFFERLVIAMHRAGVQQHVVLRDAAARMDALREAGLRPVTLPFGGRFDMKTKRSLKREIERFRPTAVLSWMSRATRFCPTGDHVLCARLGGFYDLKYYKHCDWLVCLTPDIQDHVVKAGFPKERTVHLPNFVPQARMPAVARKTHYTPENAPLIFALGRLHENKGFETLLRAVAKVPDVYLWLAGDGPLRKDLEDLAQSLGIKPRVRFLGWREDTPALYAAADLFVCPSRHEPHGNIILEAWAQGVPMIATETHGPRTLINDGVDGVLVPIDEPKAMAAAIRDVLADPEGMQSLAESGWNTFQASYTEEKVVGAYRDFFERVAAEKAAAKAG